MTSEYERGVAAGLEAAARECDRATEDDYRCCGSVIGARIRRLAAAASKREARVGDLVRVVHAGLVETAALSGRVGELVAIDARAGLPRLPYLVRLADDGDQWVAEVAPAREREAGPPVPALCSECPHREVALFRDRCTHPRAGGLRVAIGGAPPAECPLRCADDVRVLDEEDGDPAEEE